MNRTILRQKQVQDVTGLARSTIYLKIAEGNFPKQVNLGPRAVGWFADEVQAWLAECARNRDSKQQGV